jgi:MFS family permease
MGFGICYGFTYPITTSSILEIMPLKFRGKFTVLLSLFTSVGRLTAIYIGKFIIVGKVEGEWRKFVFYLALFSSFAPILCILLLNESPRFLFALKKIERGIKELDHMGRTNNSIKWIPLTEEEKY